MRSSTISDNFLIRDLARLLRSHGASIGEKRLFNWLRVNKYLVNQAGPGYNTPTRKSMEMGLFKVKESHVVHSDGTKIAKYTTVVTEKGREYFLNILADDGDYTAV